MVVRVKRRKKPKFIKWKGIIFVPQNKIASIEQARELEINAIELLVCPREGQEEIYVLTEKQALRIHDVVGRSEQLVCDVCGSTDVIEAPHMGRNCNRCHPL